MEDKNKITNKTQNTKTTATTIRTKSKSQLIDLEPEGNPFARRGSVSRSPPMLTRSDSKASEGSTASLAVEGKPPRPKAAKTQAVSQSKKAIDLDSASADSDDATVSCQKEAKGDCELGKQNFKSRVIQDIYKEKESLESFLFNESNKISRAAIKLIMSKWAVLESKLIETVLENEKSKTRINELLLDNLKLKSKAEYLPSYAGVLGASTGVQVRTHPTENLKQKTEVVLIKPTDENEIANNDEIKVKVTRALEKVKNKLKVKNIRQMNKKGLVIEMDSIKDKEIIKAVNLDEIGLKIEEPRRIEAMIIIYDVEKEYKPEELKEELIRKNIDCIGEEDSEELGRRIHFRRGFSTSNPNRLNWIVHGLYDMEASNG